MQLATLKQSERLRLVADFLSTHDLDSIISVRTGPSWASFEIPYWDQVTAEQRRLIKRLFGPLEVRGDESWKYLIGHVKLGDTEVRLEIFGAFECKVLNKREVTIVLSDAERESRLATLERLKKELETGERTETKHTYDCKQVLAQDEA